MVFSSVENDPVFVFSPEELTIGCPELSACLGVRLSVRPWWPQPSLSVTAYLHILFTATLCEQVRCCITRGHLVKFSLPHVVLLLFVFVFPTRVQEIPRFQFSTRWNARETAAVSACAQWRPSNTDSPYSFARPPSTCNRRAPCSTSSPCQWSPHPRTSSP